MTLPKIPLHPNEEPAPDDTRVNVIGPDARRRLIQEAANQHYQDQPMVTAGLSGGVLGAVLGGAGLPLLTSILQDKPMYSGMNSRDVMSASLAGGGLGAVAGLGNEALGRILTRMAGPNFEPRRWARDQDPHRFNSALKVAPLGLSVLASRLLVPHLMTKQPGAV